MAQKTWPLVKRARPGSAMAWLGDIHPANQPDGCDDFLMGYPGQNGRGEVWLVSGKDFRRVKRWIGYANGDGFGAAIAVAEFTGDNVPDYVIGAPGRPENRSGAIGKVYAFDGKTGQQLWQLTGKGITDGFGWALCFADSVPGGNPELWIGAPGYDKGDHRASPRMAGSRSTRSISRARLCSRSSKGIVLGSGSAGISPTLAI
jgi:hypothetical protein